MTTARAVLTMMFAAALSLALASPALAQDAVPALEAVTLDGDVVTLPGDLPAGRSLLVATFERKQSADLEAWKAAVDQLAERGMAVSMVSLLVMGDIPGPIRALIERAMRKEVVGDDARSRFLLIFGGREAVLADLEVDDPSTALVLLVEPGGTVTWRGRGAPTVETLTELLGALSP